MKAAVDLLQEANGRKVAVLGDMFELGDEEVKFHYEVGEYAASKTDVLICVGKLSKHIYEGAVSGKEEKEGIFYLESKEEIYRYLENILKPQDTLLLKASPVKVFCPPCEPFSEPSSPLKKDAL